MNRELLTVMGSAIRIERPVGGHLAFQKSAYPSHRVEIFLEINSHSLVIEHVRREGADSDASPYRERIDLGLDDKYLNIQAKTDDAVLSPDQVSEYVLSRILE